MIAFTALIVDLFNALPLVAQLKLTAMFLLLYCSPLLFGILLSFVPRMFKA